MDKFDTSGMTYEEALAATVPFDPPSQNIDVRLTPEAAQEFVKKSWLDLHEIRALIQGINPRRLSQQHSHGYLEEHEIALQNLKKAIQDKKLSLPCSPMMLLRCARDYKIAIEEILLEAFLETNPQATLANYIPTQICARARNKMDDRPAVERIARELWSTDATMTCDAILFHDMMKPYRAGSAAEPGVGNFAGWSDRMLREWIRSVDDNPRKGRKGRPRRAP
jgi:hypothetical protein